MNREWASKVRHSAALFFVGGIGLVLASLLSILLELDLATTAFAYLIVIVLVSLRGRFWVAALLSIVSVAILLAEPIFHFQVDLTQDLVLLVAFLVTSLIVTGLVGRARQQAEAALQAEAKAQEAERELRLAVETIPALVWSALPDGSLDFINQRWEEIGLSLDDLRGSKWTAALHPDERAGAVDKWRMAVETGTPYENIERLRTASGAYRWVLSRARPLRDERGRITKWYGTDTDIEDRIRAEEVLREQARLLDLTHDTIFVRDMHNVITYWNRGAEELYGWAAEEVIGKVTTHELLRTDFPAPIDQINAELLRTDRWEGELVHTKADGTTVVVASRWSLQRDDQGRPVATLETNNDVTERKRADLLLAREKQLLEMIARGEARSLILDTLCRLVEERLIGSLSSILLLDPNGNRLRHGSAPNLPVSYTEAIDGLVIGPTVGSCGTAAHRAKPVVVSDITTDPLWADYRDPALAHGLRACWSTPILSSAGRVLGTFAVYYHEPHTPTPQEMDVVEQVTHLASIAVERKQAEEALRERASLLDLTHDSIFVRDMGDVITYWNRGATELYGWTREEALHKVSHQLTQTIFPAPLAEINAELLRTGRWEGELIHTKRDGKQVVVVSRWSLQRDEDGLPVAILETNNDITNRKRAEEALRQAQADLVHAARVTTLGELTASIAHEVNQPLAGVVSSGNACLRWLAGQPPNIESARQSLGRIIRDANRASDVVGRIRSLAKKDTLQKGWLNVNETVAETISLTRMQVAQHHASLRAQLSQDVPLVWGDRIQLQQVLLNLIINALEAVSAAGDGPRNLSVSTGKHESDGVLLAVRDSGSGLDPANLEHIFDAFYTTKREGMGLGLAVSRSIIEAHGGRLWAAPNEPRGAVFQFTLPIGREEVS